VAYLRFGKRAWQKPQRGPEQSPWSGSLKAETLNFWTFSESVKFAHCFKIWKRRKNTDIILCFSPNSESPSIMLWRVFVRSILCFLVCCLPRIKTMNNRTAIKCRLRSMMRHCLFIKLTDSLVFNCVDKTNSFDQLVLLCQEKLHVYS